MSLHISAKKNAIAEKVLMPGDPLRAKFIAENFLEDAVCYNEVRGMLGYTGTYQGERISVQGSGMGMPSMAIYATELMNDFGAKTLIRVGTCGAFRPELKIGDIIIAMAASTDSAMNTLSFGNADFAAHADSELFVSAVQHATSTGIKFHAGGVVSTDAFYAPHHNLEAEWIKHGVLATDMETSILYTLALRFGAKALSILTISDNLATDEHATIAEREQSFTQMMGLALEICEKEK